MPTRFLKESICTSESLSKLTAQAERFWYRLIVQCDDFGRMDARPTILRALCFPLMLSEVVEENIVAWLVEMSDAALITIYAVNGKPYLQVNAFTTHNSPRAKTSRWPHPQEDDGSLAHLQAFASICERLQASASNGMQMSPYSYSYSDAKANIGGVFESAQVSAPPVVASANFASNGRQQAKKLEELNGQIPAVTRLPIVESLLDLYGYRAMVEAGDDGTLYACHEQAVMLYKMGFHDADAIENLAVLWKEQDWRGKKGERPRQNQFIEFASQHKGVVAKARRTPRTIRIIDPDTGAESERVVQ